MKEMPTPYERTQKILNDAAKAGIGKANAEPWKDREWRLYAVEGSLWTDTEEGRRCVADVMGPGNVELAEFLVLTANAHEQLVAACRAAKQFMETGSNPAAGCIAAPPAEDAVWEMLDAALAGKAQP